MHKNRSKIDSQLSISTNMCFRNTTNWQIKKLNEKIVWKIIKNQAKLRITIFSILQDELNRNSSVGGEISWTRNRDNSLNTVAILLSRSRNCFRSRVETYVCLTERGTERAIHLRVDEKTSFSRRAYLLAARTSFDEWNNPVTGILQPLKIEQQSLIRVWGERVNSLELC